MAFHFTLHKSPAPALTVIFNSDGFERARRFKQGLISDGLYSEEQITISGTDADGNLVSG
jgi:hypothetical protein